MRKIEIIVPSLFNTYEKPTEPNNYSVYIPKNESEECEIYIGEKWFKIIHIVQDKTKQSELDEDKVVSDKEYELIKAIRKYREEES